MAVENIEDLYRLSPVQQGMLFHSLASPGTGVYFEQFSLVYRSGFDPEAFARAWQRAVDRHPVLRTSFLWEGLEQPVQVVHRRVELAVDRQDWRRLSPAEGDERLRAYAAADRRSGFDLARPPLLRLGLIRTAEQEHRVVWGYHHLLLDGWSAGLLMREVFALYREESGGEPAQLEPRRPYKDYVDWLFAQDLSAAEAYWRSTLAGVAAPTPLVVDAAPATHETDSGYELRLLRVPAPATAALKAFAQGNRLTLNTLLQGAWALLLARTSGEEDVVFGTTVSGRPPSLPGVESMIGCFINTLPVRVRVAPGQELASWLRELQGGLVEMRRYEYSPLAQVLGWSEVPRPQPLFESIVVFESFTPESAFEMSHSGVFQRTNYPLTLVASPGTELSLRVGYEPGRFRADAIERLLRHLEVLLREMASGGRRRLDELPLLSAPERQQVVVEWNATRVDEFLASDLTLHGLVEAQAARTPEAVALVFEDERLSYGELNARANRLARHLQRLGIGPEARVGVCLERSMELVVGLLAVLKAGGAYLPLDPSYPRERLAVMLEDAHRGMERPVLLVQERLLAALPAGFCGERSEVVLLQAGWGAGAAEDAAAPAGSAGPDHAAYVIFTSGSTGRPKGVVNTHRGIVNRLLWMQQTYRLTAEDRVLQKTPASFDVSVCEFFWPLLAGARLVVARPGGHQDPAYLARLIVEQGITTVHFVPTMLQAFLDEPEVERCTCLRRVIASGEALSTDLVRRFHARFADRGVELHNLYGPTEAAVDVTFWPCERPAPGPTAPIGRPVANTEIHLLDRQLQPVPIGVTGELYIGGVQLARGYLGRPELTAEKFIPDSFRDEPGARLYQTGDLARSCADGAVEFLGRLDDQVKIRGFRIELGEIESVLAAHPAVREAAVAARESAAGSRRLVAYLVAREGLPIRPDELRVFLATKLPEPLVPSAFVELPALPLTPSGKLDRRALPAPGAARPDLEQSFVEPRTPAERALAEIWARVLGVERVGAHDNFFTLGGDSILTLLVVVQSRAAGIHLLPRQLFQHPTVARLAAAAGAGESGQEPWPRTADGPPARLFSLAAGVDREALDRLAGRDAEVEDVYPLSPGQQDMLAHSLLSRTPEVYFQQMCFTLRGALDVPAFAAAWQRVIERNPALRTTFAWEGLDEPLQVVRRLDVPLEPLDWSGMLPAEQETRLRAWLESDIAGGFDFSRLPLLRLTLIRLAEGEHRFVWSFHHLLLDGWSISRLLTEVLDLYGALREGREPTLTERRPFHDYIAWLRRQDLAATEAFWRRELAGFTSPTRLPAGLDPAGAAGERPSYGELRARLPAQPTAGLQTLARREGLTLNTLVQGAWAVLLSRAAGEREVVFGVTGSGRAAPLPGVESMIGLLMNTLPLRVEVDPDTPLLPWLQQLQERQSRMLEHEHTPPARLREWCEVPGDLPLFESILRFENYPVSVSSQELEGELTIGGLLWSDHWHYPLNLVVVPGAVLTLQITYSRSRFTAANVSGFLDELRDLLVSFALQAEPRSGSDAPGRTSAQSRHVLDEGRGAGLAALD